MDLYLYPRHFGPLFRSFFGKAARFCSRQNVEFRPAFLLVLPNTHFKHRCRRVSRLCDVSDVKTAGKPHPTPGRKHGVLAMLGREKTKHPLQRSGWPFICWISAEHRFLMSRPSCPYGLRGYRGRAARETSARSESDSDQMWRAYSHADGAAPGDGHRFVCRFQHFAHLSAVFRYTLTASILPANTSRKHTHSAYFCRRALSNKDTKSRRP